MDLRAEPGPRDWESRSVHPVPGERRAVHPLRGIGILAVLLGMGSMVVRARDRSWNIGSAAPFYCGGSHMRGRRHPKSHSRAFRTFSRVVCDRSYNECSGGIREHGGT
jgi:hypothetical protein